jgi:D-alanyl-D-alanine carboxypeptidase (penicillin-binding protein 5/6)
MKKLRYIVFSLVFVMILTAVPTAAESKKVKIIGDSAIVVDVETGDVLYGKNSKVKRYPASITKIMTALITLERCDLDENVIYSQAALYSIEPGSSAAYIKPGEKMTVEESLYVMMLRSANDVAHGLAYHVGGDLPGFAALMNQKAKKLGCTNTNFVNASGLHAKEHYTTAADMAKIARAAYENPTLRKIMNTPRYNLPATNKYDVVRPWVNGNRMIQSGSEYYYEPCLGGKTGYTTVAGGTLVTYAKIHDRVLACVVLKSKNSASAYSDSIKLYKYVDKHGDFRAYQKRDPVIEETTTEVDHSGEEIIYGKEPTMMDKVITGVKIAVGIVLVLCVGVILRIVHVQRIKRKRRRRRQGKKRR